MVILSSWMAVTLPAEMVSALLNDQFRIVLVQLGVVNVIALTAASSYRETVRSSLVQIQHALAAEVDLIGGQGDNLRWRSSR